MSHFFAIFQILSAIGDDLLASLQAGGQCDGLAFDEGHFDFALTSVLLVEHEHARGAAIAFDDCADRNIDAFARLCRGRE